MTAEQAVWVLLAYGVIVTSLLVVSVGAYAEVAQENRRLRGDHLHLIHPSTRRTNR